MRYALMRFLSTIVLLCLATGARAVTIVPHVDLPRFMGNWYVIANIPTSIEKGAHNAVESYTLQADGSIATKFTFRANAFDGALKDYPSRAFVLDTASNAVWGVQFVWPFKADYRIMYLEADYSVAVIGREKRDYLWVLARKPELAEDDYQRLLKFVAAQGYDIAQVQRVPQQWK